MKTYLAGGGTADRGEEHVDADDDCLPVRVECGVMVISGCVMLLAFSFGRDWRALASARRQRVGLGPFTCHHH
jgi:hypothetical protein